VGIGTISYKTRLEEQLKKQAEDVRVRMHEIFERECKDRNVSFEWLSFDGDPIEAMYLAMETRDLVITGHDTTFRGNLREQLSEILEKLLIQTPRPVIICADDIPGIDESLIAYDGSVPAMRAFRSSHFWELDRASGSA
jgi:hypothetical protein